MTTKITDFASLKATSKEFDKDLEALFEKYGLTLTRRNASMGAGVISYSIRASIGTGADAGKAEWDAYHRIYNLPTDAYGKTIYLSGKPYKVVGIDSRSRKQKCVRVARQPDGRVFVVDPDTVRIKLAIREPESSG